MEISVPDFLLLDLANFFSDNPSLGYCLNFLHIDGIIKLIVAYLYLYSRTLMRMLCSLITGISVCI